MIKPSTGFETTWYGGCYVHLLGGCAILSVATLDRVGHEIV
jgi:hypothetical protein